MAISVQSTLDTPDAATTSSTGTSGRDLQHRSKSNPTNSKSSLGTDRLSIVNLLYDDETSVAEPNFTAPAVVGRGVSRQRPSDSAPKRPGNEDMDLTEFAIADDDGPGVSNKRKGKTPAHPYRRGTFPTQQTSDNYGRGLVEQSIEKEYLRIFFSNLYYIHPFLSEHEFVARCESTIWSRWPLNGVPRGDLHFLALYNVVLAVGSLISSQEIFASHKRQMDQLHDGDHSDIASAASSIQLSKIFIDRSKRLLGDCFEVCSLESAQTLMLMVSPLTEPAFKFSEHKFQFDFGLHSHSTFKMF